mmetsp:Transcript_17771/g.32962  ORF Transcript_17771/g.32962 Transcript_17771/m.32962 type:complete len:240 (-) Transcript_17771:452-1171(-)
MSLPSHSTIGARCPVAAASTHVALPWSSSSPSAAARAASRSRRAPPRFSCVGAADLSTAGVGVREPPKESSARPIRSFARPAPSKAESVNSLSTVCCHSVGAFVDAGLLASGLLGATGGAAGAPQVPQRPQELPLPPLAESGATAAGVAAGGASGMLAARSTADDADEVDRSSVVPNSELSSGVQRPISGEAARSTAMAPLPMAPWLIFRRRGEPVRQGSSGVPRMRCGGGEGVTSRCL